jgi:hypothetical protein
MLGGLAFDVVLEGDHVDNDLYEYAEVYSVEAGSLPKFDLAQGVDLVKR